MATPIKFRTEVSRVVEHADDVVSYEFRYLDRRPRFKPGQFLHLALDPYDPAGHWPDSRPFTIANGSTDLEKLRLTIAAKGPFTQRLLRELQPGRQVWMKAPYGEFIVQTDRERETVLIGGGTGVTPFVACLEDALVRGLDGDVWLHYGARQERLLIFRDLVDRCAARFPALHVQYYIEQGAAAGAVPGRIDLARACGVLRRVSTATFYLCGPQAMIQAVRGALLEAWGVAASQIRVDAWC